MSQHPRIVDVISQLDLPNPTIPVPFEKFAALGDSEDLLQRAAFWTFYAAWLSDKHDQRPETAVQARNDAHTIHRVTQEMALRDCVMMRRDDLARLEHEAEEGQRRTHSVMLWIWIACAFVCGLVLGVILWW